MDVCTGGVYPLHQGVRGCGDQHVSARTRVYLAAEGVLLFESVLAGSTVPDVVLLGFMTDVLVTLDVPFSALISSSWLCLMKTSRLIQQ